MRRARLSLKVRLMLIITTLIGVFCIAAGLYILRRAQNNIRDEVYSAVGLVERYLDAELTVSRQGWSMNSNTPPTLHLSTLSDVRHVDVYFYNALGILLEKSTRDPPQRAAVPLWFAWIAQRSLKPMPDIRRFVSFGGYIGGALIIHPNPAFQLDEVWHVTRGLFGLLLILSVSVNLLVWWAVGRALRPVRQLGVALNEFGAGHLDARLPEFQLPELAPLGTNFNRMAEKLERSTSENHRLTRRLIEVQEEERNQIARELHDEIGQCVTAIHADAATIRNVGGSSDPLVRESADAILDVTAQIKVLVRRMLQRLRPESVERIGLQAGLTELLTAFGQRHPAIPCTLNVNAGADVITGETAVAVYRVVQESLTNIARHANAHRISVEVGCDPVVPAEDAPTRVVVVVQDDGAGFDPSAVDHGFGLIGMRERIQRLNGSLTIESTKGRGTRIEAAIPWHELNGVAA